MSRNSRWTHYEPAPPHGHDPAAKLCRWADSCERVHHLNSEWASPQTLSVLTNWSDAREEFKFDTRCLPCIWEAALELVKGPAKLPKVNEAKSQET